MVKFVLHSVQLSTTFRATLCIISLSLLARDSIML